MTHDTTTFRNYLLLCISLLFLFFVSSFSFALIFGMANEIRQLGLTLALLHSFKSKSLIIFIIIIIIFVCLQFQTSNTLYIANYERWQWWRQWRWLVAMCIELFIIIFFFFLFICTHFSCYYIYIAKRGRKMNNTENWTQCILLPTVHNF